jgi:4-alpha-glucanotransferase
VILHPTSLPGPYGIGELGQEAFRFIDWLHSAGMQCWQVSYLLVCCCMDTHFGWQCTLIAMLPAAWC